ncbi:MAG: 16S rRNA (guanine(966)-N(2))-methyltransferase RsmD [Thermodesulfobacteriota bacterium]
MRIISGRYGGRAIRSVSGPGYRPATGKVRGAVFSMLEARGLAWPGARVADLFAGSGSLGLEALSRGAAFALFVESSRAAAAAISATLADFGVGRAAAEVRAADVFKVLKNRPARPFSAVFVDPPYGKGFLPPALEQIMANGWLAPEGLLLAEVEAGLDLDPAGTHPGLEPATDRLYGQTRIILWTRRNP